MKREDHSARLYVMTGRLGRQKHPQKLLGKLLLQQHVENGAQALTPPLTPPPPFPIPPNKLGTHDARVTKETH